METTIKFTVHSDYAYEYEVGAGGKSVDLTYREIFNGSDASTQISFGSLCEMEAVAKAMLQVVSLRRDTQ